MHMSSDPETIQIVSDRIVKEFLDRVDSGDATIKASDAMQAIKMSREARDEQENRKNGGDPDLSTLKDEELDAELKRINDEINRLKEEDAKLDEEFRECEDREKNTQSK